MAVVTGGPELCMVCGRGFFGYDPRQGSWDDVRYCSHRCHRRRLMASDYRLEAAIELLLSDREGRKKSALLDPREAARLVDRIGWRSLMEATLMAARRLAVAGRLEFVQEGLVVDPSTAKGPILLRRKQSP